MTSNIRPPKLGPKIDPDNAPATAVVVVEPRDDLDVEFGTRTVTAGLALDMDAAVIVAGMAEGWLLHTRKAVTDGVRPDGGGDQKPLGARAANAPDRLSEHRNYRTGELADGLRATAIESKGQTASCRGLPPLSRQAHVVKERARGVDLITLRGAAGKAAVDGARAAVEAMLTGREVIIDAGEKEAGDV